MTFKFFHFFLVWQAQNIIMTSSTSSSSPPPPPSNIYQLCRELQNKETNGAQTHQLQGLFPSGSRLYIIYRQQVFTVPFNPNTVFSSGKLLPETGTHLGSLSSQPWARRIGPAVDNNNSTLKNVYMLFTPTGKAEANALFVQGKPSGRLCSQTYELESGKPTRFVLAGSQFAEVTSEYAILTDGDQRTYVLAEHDPANPTQLLLVPYITRKSGNLTLPFKKLETIEPLQQQYWMSQINEHFISFSRKQSKVDAPLALGRFPKHFPNVGFLVKWGDKKTMHLFETRKRRVHILVDPAAVLQSSADQQKRPQSVPLIDSVDYSTYFRCRSQFEHVLDICTSAYGILLIGLALILLCVSVYTCCSKVRGQGKLQANAVGAGKTAAPKGGTAKSSEKTTLIELHIASSALDSSASSSTAPSVSAPKTTSTASQQGKVKGKTAIGLKHKKV